MLADPGRDARGRAAVPGPTPAARRLAHIRAVLATRIALGASEEFTAGLAW